MATFHTIIYLLCLFSVEMTRRQEEPVATITNKHVVGRSCLPGVQFFTPRLRDYLPLTVHTSRLICEGRSLELVIMKNLTFFFGDESRYTARSLSEQTKQVKNAERLKNIMQVEMSSSSISRAREHGLIRHPPPRRTSHSPTTPSDGVQQVRGRSREL